nr:ACT domain-containing protein [uncultured Lachnoclostridium sp.]
MELIVIEQEFTVCKIDDVNKINFSDEYCFLGKTKEEISLVCSTSYAPTEVIERSDGWRAFRIHGILDFSLIGILSKITTILAENHIGVFAVSTYNTDYILTKTVDYEKALDALEQQGYRINRR